MNTFSFKTMQPCDAFLDKIKFPCIAQPKVDGVKGTIQNATALGRSLKKHANKATTEFFSNPAITGFEGEFTTGDDPTTADLCRVTSGDLSRITGMPDVYFWVFDYVTEQNRDFPYVTRLEQLSTAIDNLALHNFKLQNKIKVVPSKMVYTLEQLLEFEAWCLEDGYEGIIVRDPQAPYKFGKCGKTFMGCWRVKRFIDAEFLITEIIEGSKNNNEATTNELGRTERSSHKENLEPNGMVGTIRGTLIADILDPQTGELLLAKGLTIDVAPGKMTHAERSYFFQNQGELLQKIGKFKLFPKGLKDKPRFSQFLCLRDINDME